MAQQETDIDALQAQIELSNSIAFDIVSSWMKPSSSSNIKSSAVSSRTTARDLEELARRPPRLGLGATVPKSTTATMQEAARLKGKLSKKPARDRDERLRDNKKNGKNEDDDEEEEESRNTVIAERKSMLSLSKKAGVVDVFASNKKRKRSNSHSELPDVAGPMSNRSLFELRGIEEAPVSLSLVPPPLKKRKEKGKNGEEGESLRIHTNAQSSTPFAGLSDEEWTGFADEVLQGADDIVANGPPSTPLSSPRSGSEALHNPRRTTLLSPVSHATLDSTSLKTNNPVPLLNILGPPPSFTVDAFGEADKTDVRSDKKERRRRKRKKRSLDGDPVLSGNT